MDTNCKGLKRTGVIHTLMRTCMQMGHATAEAVVRAGLTLVPYTFTGRSEAVAVGNVGVCGVPVELVTAEERQDALNSIKGDYPDLVVVDYTLPSAVNGMSGWSCLSFVYIGQWVYIHIHAIPVPPPVTPYSQLAYKHMQIMHCFIVRIKFLLLWELLVGIEIN